MANILAIDDDKAILDMIGAILNKDGHTITKLANPLEFNLAVAGQYDLILLDVMMPGIDGFALCAKIRSQVDCPIIFLTAKSGEGNLVDGLALGADDYICKPFGMMELRARISAHLRREHREHSIRISFERACFHISQKQMTVDGETVLLTKSEYDICEFLARNHGQIFSKEQILEHVFGFDNESNESTITTHIKNIRTKLLQKDYAPIKTVWGVGYRWEE